MFDDLVGRKTRRGLAAARRRHARACGSKALGHGLRNSAAVGKALRLLLCAVRKWYVVRCMRPTRRPRAWRVACRGACSFCMPRRQPRRRYAPGCGFGKAAAGLPSGGRQRGISLEQPGLEGLWLLRARVAAAAQHCNCGARASAPRVWARRQRERDARPKGGRRATRWHCLAVLTCHLRTAPSGGHSSLLSACSVRQPWRVYAMHLK
jgi:hypothetical protein